MSQHFTLIADRVWDGQSDSAQAGIAVVVSAGLVERLSPVADLPTDLPRVELPGATLLPGLIDAHVHYTTTMGPAFLAAGVTTVRDVGNDLDWILARRALHEREPTLGPRIVCCGRLLDGPHAHWPRFGRAHLDDASIVASIREHVERGVDQIKLYAGLDPALLRVAVAESRKLGKFTLAHLRDTNANEAVSAGLHEIEHLTECDPAWRDAAIEEDDQLIDAFRERGVVQTPTLVVWDRLGRILDLSLHHDARRSWADPILLNIWWRFRKRYRSRARRARLQEAMPHLKRFLRRAHERGVRIGLGTDTPFPHLIPGFSLHDELALYVDAGIKPVDALRSATSINAAVLGIHQRVGRIAPEMVADLMAVRGDPLEDIASISAVEMVVRAGHCLGRAKLQHDADQLFHLRSRDPVTDDLDVKANQPVAE
jgi:imidazolonepropionase-like amidohydrolase